jgi:hypothetical protein
METHWDRRSLYIVFLAAIAAVPAMATDMYLAALPVIAAECGVPGSQIALALAPMLAPTIRATLLKYATWRVGRASLPGAVCTTPRLPAPCASSLSSAA